MFKLILFLLCCLSISQNSFASEYRILEMYVDSSGNDASTGTESNPIKSLFEAQRRADQFIGELDPGGENKSDYIKVRIFVKGTFYGQSFLWGHPHQNIHLDFRAKTGDTATFYGYRHECFNCPEGIQFFNAYSKSTDYKSYKGYSGYGSISIKNIVVKYYMTAINLSAWEDTNPGSVSITGNTFYRIGQIANPDIWGDGYTAINVDTIKYAEFKNNTFIQIANNADENPNLMHSIYLKNSDRNLISNNYFENNSGQPIKLRNGSDHNSILSNSFYKGSYSVALFPIQNWYEYWYKEDSYFDDPSERELPSMGNIIDGNSYQNGYIDTPKPSDLAQIENVCIHRTFASPDVLPQTYLDHAERESTNSRYIVRGIKYYHTHWWNMDCGQYY